MPPSGRSSSSHSSGSSSRSYSSSSSSSRSSSYSSSSHSSGSSGRSYSGSSSSRSSSYSSSSHSWGTKPSGGPSKRSGSTHNSGSSSNRMGNGPGTRSTSSYTSQNTADRGFRSAGSSHNNKRDYNPTYHPDINSPLTRTRYRQPVGYDALKHGAVREYHCVHHDYVYYPVSWENSYNGKTYKKGYYDEEGNHYDSLVMKERNSDALKFICRYCDSEALISWTEGMKPVCPNCGAQLELEGEAEDELAIPKQELLERRAREYRGERIRDIVLKTLAVVGIAAMLFSYGSKYVSSRNTVEREPATIVMQADNDELYIEAIGRYCKWHSEYDSYYDQPTDCYFAFYKDGENEAWQYWYEDISSDYGDYGWMEYDEDEERWYIEASAGEWIVLPEKYDTSSLWHIPWVDYVYVEQLGRVCTWYDEYDCYYDPPTDCYFGYFRYDDYSTWQYWYEGISSDYGDYGWMEYDEGEQQWYIEAAEGEWIVLPEKYDTSSLWHM